jgi:type I restriction enzyme, R subunit
MTSVNKADLSERDIYTRFITPAIQQAGWDLHTQVREEVTFTNGRIIVRGQLVSRGKSRRADYVLYHTSNIPIALIEAKDHTHSVGAGMQQALAYAEALDIPFVYSSNGDGFLEHDRTVHAGAVERELSLDQFPSPTELWARYCAWKGLSAPAQQIVAQAYYSDGSGRAPRYYQLTAINRVVEAIARGQQRILLY